MTPTDIDKVQVIPRAPIGVFGQPEINAVRALCDIIHGDEPLSRLQLSLIAAARDTMQLSAHVEIHEIVTPLDRRDLQRRAEQASARQIADPVQFTLRMPHSRQVLVFHMKTYFRSDHVLRFDGTIEGRTAYLYVSSRGQEILIIHASAST